MEHTSNDNNSVEVSNNNESQASKICEQIKLVIASMAVFLLILVIFVGVSLKYCVLQLFPLVNFILMFGCLILLAYVEALHYAVVAVEKWDMAQYADTFPRAVKCHKLVDTPQKVKQNSLSPFSLFPH
jgi:hypothetical protein